MNRLPTADSMKKLLLLSLLLLTACNSTSLTSTPLPDDGTPDVFSFATETPSPTPTYEGCAFVWASHELPDLSQKVQSALQKLDSSITASASAYGEDCVYADGHSTFGTMETDFRVQAQVKDLKNEKILGDWIAKIMTVIEQLPSDQVPGAQPGLVDIKFNKNIDEFLFVRIEISKYRREANGKTGAELFRLFYQKP